MVGQQIVAFADKHKLKRISVADLIAYRQAREKLVERVACFPVRTPIRRASGLRLSHAVRSGPAFRLRARRHRRRTRNAGAAASGRYRQRHFRRRRHSARAPAVQGGGPRRAGLPARRRGGGAREPRAAPRRQTPTGRARRYGAKSDWARRSCATSASPRSGCAPTTRAPMSGFRASASRSRRWSRSTGRLRARSAFHQRRHMRGY